MDLMLSIVSMSSPISVQNAMSWMHLQFHLQRAPTPTLPSSLSHDSPHQSPNTNPHTPVSLLFSDCTRFLHIPLLETSGSLFTVQANLTLVMHPPIPAALSIVDLLCLEHSLEHFPPCIALYCLWFQVYPSTWIMGKSGGSTHIDRVLHEARMSAVHYTCKDFRNVRG